MNTARKLTAIAIVIAAAAITSAILASFAFGPSQIFLLNNNNPGNSVVDRGDQAEYYSGVAFNGTSSPFPGNSDIPNLPKVNDTGLKVEQVVSGLSTPTSMAFIDNDKILVLQKDSGKVRLVSNGTLQPEPILDVFVQKESERGLLGIAVMDKNATTISLNSSNATAAASTPSEKMVFLYLTELDNKGEVRNRVYRYEWKDDRLVNPVLILDLPGTPGPNHNGGKLISSKENNYLFAVIGDLNRDGTLQNFKEGTGPDNTSVVFRVDPDGKPVKGNPFMGNGSNNTSNANRYYAYGIRNSFGMDLDSVTGTLWMTENGPASYDEINIVNPGFNSGWQRIMGPIERSDKNEGDLVSLPNSKYHDPVFSWYQTKGITDLEFFNSSRLGEKYENNIFVGDINNGNLYFFKVNANRTGLDFAGNPDSAGLSDLVADNQTESLAVTIGTHFGGITDIETGPDGYLYVLSYGDGKIYRIVPSTQQ